MKREVQFAEQVIDRDSEEQMIRQQEAGPGPHSSSGPVYASYPPWAVDNDGNEMDGIPAGQSLGFYASPKRRITLDNGEAALKAQEEVATCCTFGTRALTQTLDFIATSMGMQKSTQPEYFDSAHFTEANANLTEYQKACARRAMQDAGFENNRNLKPTEVMILLRLLGHFPESWRIDCAVQELRMQSSETFTYGEALHVWTYFLFHHEEELQMLKRAFQFFDRDSSGYITYEEMHDSNLELEDPLSDDEIRKFIELLDKNGDGNLQYEDFFGIAENILVGPNSAFDIDQSLYHQQPYAMMIPENSMILDRHIPPDLTKNLPIVGDNEEKPLGMCNQGKQPSLSRDDSALRSSPNIVKQGADCCVESWQSTSSLTQEGPADLVDEVSPRRLYDSDHRVSQSMSSASRVSVSGSAESKSYDSFIPGGLQAVSTPEELAPGAFNIVRDDGKLQVGDVRSSKEHVPL